MKALRIVLTQNKAHYRKEESVTNKMTYPLPPFSTVIGALHKACNFKEYYSMDLSIQGRYKSLIKQPYTDYCFLNRVMDDRGILVKFKTGSLQSTGFRRVAEAVKSTDNSFRKGVTIQVYNQELIEEYRKLKKIADEIEIFKVRKKNGKKIAELCKVIIEEKNNLTNSKEDKARNKILNENFKNYTKDTSKGIENLLKIRKKSLADKKKNCEKNSEEYIKLSNREKEIKAKEKLIEEKVKEFEKQNYTDNISRFQSLTTSLKFYEVLHDVRLVIHVKSDDETLKKIKDNIYNLKAIGRSEDFVDVKDCEEVELSEDIKDDFKSEYSAYLNYNDVKNENIFFGKVKDGIPANGTKYYINKVYTNEKGWRDFEKVKVVYASNYRIDEDSENVYTDNEYIVNFN